LLRVSDAIIQGLLAPPSRSFPYIALAAAYLDGKPIDAEPPDHYREDLSNLTREQLRDRAVALANRLQEEARESLPVIDVTPEPTSNG